MLSVSVHRHATPRWLLSQPTSLRPKFKFLQKSKPCPAGILRAASSSVSDSLVSPVGFGGGGGLVCLNGIAFAGVGPSSTGVAPLVGPLLAAARAESLPCSSLATAEALAFPSLDPLFNSARLGRFAASNMDSQTCFALVLETMVLTTFHASVREDNADCMV
eukprot:359151-Amphidinium_carterae.5